jgi:opacity protein-like surface antigen
MTGVETGMPTPRRLLDIALVVAAFAAPLRAQDDTLDTGRHRHRHREPTEFERRSAGSIAFIQMRPTGDLGRNIGFGYGGVATGLFRLDHAGALSLRGDLGLLGYGHESKRAPLSPTIGGRIQVDLSTTNGIFAGSLGPQLTVPRGIVRPYVHAGWGFQLFFTESSVGGSDNSFDFADTMNHSDWTSTWTTGGGVYVPLHSGRVPVLLDLGATYFTGGHATYLKRGGIEDLPDGQIRLHTMQSDTRLMLVRLGVKIGG